MAGLLRQLFLELVLFANMGVFGIQNHPALTLPQKMSDVSNRTWVVALAEDHELSESVSPQLQAQFDSFMVTMTARLSPFVDSRNNRIVSGFIQTIYDPSFGGSGLFVGTTYQLDKCTLSPAHLASFQVSAGSVSVTVPKVAQQELNGIATRSGGAITQGWIDVGLNIFETAVSDFVPGGEIGTALFGMALGLVTAGLELGNQYDSVLENGVPDPNDLINDNFKKLQAELGQVQSRMYSYIDKRNAAMATYVDNKVAAAQVQTAMTNKMGEYMTLVGSWRNAMELVLFTRQAKASFGTSWSTLLMSVYNQIVGSYSSFTLKGTELASNVLLLSESLFLFTDYMGLFNSVTNEVLMDELIGLDAFKSSNQKVNIRSIAPLVMSVLATYTSTLTDAIAYADSTMKKVLHAFGTELYPEPGAGYTLVASGKTCGTSSNQKWLWGEQTAEQCMVKVTMTADCAVGSFLWRGRKQYTQDRTCGCNTRASIDCTASANQNADADVDLYSTPTLTGAQQALRGNVQYVSNWDGKGTGKGAAPPEVVVNVAPGKTCEVSAQSRTNVPSKDYMIDAGAALMGRYVVASLQFKMYAEVQPRINQWQQMLAKATASLTTMKATYL